MNDALIKKIEEMVHGSLWVDRFGTPEWSVEPGALVGVVQNLKSDPQLLCTMLIDMVGIDYLNHLPSHGNRFAVVYHLKSLQNRFRCSLRVSLPMDDAVVPTISHIFQNANWLEREAFDQLGIHFDGHPDLRRILNHHQFAGHPLRKDYPIDQRQWLTQADTLMEPMEVRLKEKGYL